MTACRRHASHAEAPRSGGPAVIVGDGGCGTLDHVPKRHESQTTREIAACRRVPQLSPYLASVNRRLHPLTLRSLLFRGADVAPHSPVVVGGDAPARLDWRSLRARVCGLGAALRSAGVGGGTRVGTLLWNDLPHLELSMAVPLLGAVLHPANPRLSDDDLAWTIAAAGDRILFHDAEFSERLHRLATDGRLPSVKRFIRVGSVGDDLPPPSIDTAWLRWEEFVAAGPETLDWPDLDEEQPVAICFTGGTTGRPKQVLYTHRSCYLHTLGLGLVDTMSLGGTDTVLPAVQFFHAIAWGIPYAAAMTGASLVLPGRSLDATNLLPLMEAEGVTLSIGVPTVWLSLAEKLRREPHRWRLRELRRIFCGGGAPTLELAEFLRRRLDVELIHSWGMTELNPVGTSGREIAVVEDLAAEPQARRARLLAAGRPMPGLEAEILDDRGAALPHDGEAVGLLVVRGPTVLGGAAPEPAAGVPAGWMPTGDVASIDSRGRIWIRDREKDLIKSGGEWISSIALERLILAMPGVRLAAVVSQPHPRWQERPVAVVELEIEHSLDLPTLHGHLAAAVPRWQMPDALLLEPVPLTGTGKVDKKRIRAMLAERDFHLPEGAAPGE